MQAIEGHRLQDSEHHSGDFDGAGLNSVELLDSGNEDRGHWSESKVHFL